mmetsp:Transcript_27741/g.72831  ORF Transcript_27741/g.72831 Transcript_27741/m.72831 type:complete len:1000 (-) Transcript_27741:1314-4313(-)|eukprot:CAMPEP_0182948292 /NCGR_PEP_ID=MMETSP0105_2-20130417/59683_1 /TAXON_ID=81532 ORGANISM="Acanthoeca-like sp., Strain 10tr" /NCGR_SAMPLE_ID=MMETSP0105_2 /ASSEMBLY_ACC=CAM_ASM_000205 /LENGTH=999 /DNA_ID=CAMNT_0025088581 /DNA_START=192 /DNA_END=3191 /DNA_ORIENTATION=+
MPGHKEEQIKVMVRVRPFNKREKERNAKCIIGMKGKQTTITNPQDGKERSFNFDTSYWSFDGFKEQDDGVFVPNSPTSKFSGQLEVFEHVGKGVLQNAYQGFNTSLFAYGQTGSGKSYSMVGYGANKGIVPMAFDAMFRKIRDNKDPNVKYQVTLSMLEIYMEQVTDLLAKRSDRLKVRQDPKKGRFFVAGLSNHPVSSYEEIEKKMDDGVQKRTVAATQMNATSSRAHTMVTLVFTQNITEKDGESERKTTRTSEINLVDLAGSERASSSGAEGIHLKEGAAINQSLSALGNVIAALAKGKRAPFRDSVLTKLLQNSLGGNAKTIMIAALSPADINYDETLSTLRYADRAKQIKTNAVVNESATEKLIREMREENERLKALLISAQAGGKAGDIENLQAMIEQNNAQTAGMDESEYEKKLQELRAEFEAEKAEAAAQKAKKLESHRITNLNEDPALSGVVTHYLEDGENMVGRKAKQNVVKPRIALSGISIQDHHATLVLRKGSVYLEPPQDIVDESSVLLNGKPLTVPTKLRHFDRILFGCNHLFVYINPRPPKEELDGLPSEIEWEFAQAELAEAKGFGAKQGAGGGAADARDDSIHLSTQTREEVMQLLPMVTVANTISERLDKRRIFEIAVLSGPVAGLQRNESKVMIKMRNLDSENKWMLECDEFVNRHFVMQKMLRTIAEREDDDENVSVCDLNLLEEGEADPFNVEPGPIILGTATCFLQSLCYRIECDDELNIVDYKGRNEGKLQVSVFPCNEKGVRCDPNDVNEDPRNLLKKKVSFEIIISGAQLRKAKYVNGVFVKFGSKHIGEVSAQTKMIKGTNNPQFKYKTVFTIPKVTPEILEWLEHGNLGFFVYVWQSDVAVADDPLRKSTKELAKRRRASTSGKLVASGTALGDAGAELTRLRAENTRMKKMTARLEEENKLLKVAVAPDAKDKMEKLCKLLQDHWSSTGRDHRGTLADISAVLDIHPPKEDPSSTKARLGKSPRSSACTIM